MRPDATRRLRFGRHRGRDASMAQFARPQRLALRSLSLLLVAAIACAAEEPPKTLVFRGATLIDGTGAAARENMVVAVRGERIVAVQDAAAWRSDAAQEVIDVGGKFMIPGLVNTHVHLATNAEPRPAKAYLKRELYSGVTTVRDMAGDVRLLAELKREAEFNEIPSPDIFYVALMAGPNFFIDPRTHDAARGRVAGEVPWMRAITAQTNLPLAVAEAKGTGATAIKIYGDLPGSLVKAITAEAHRQHLRVWAHAAVFPARPSEVVNAGVDVVSHACLVGYEATKTPLAYHSRKPVDTTAIRSNARIAQVWADMKRRGTILDATLYVYDNDPSPTCPPGAADFLAAEAYRAGVAISTGTDDDFDWKEPDSALDHELSLLVEKAGMTPADLIRSATLVGARTVGQEKEFGSVEIGKLANLVILDKNPLDGMANLHSVSLVVKRGIRYPRADYRPASAEETKP
jgi:imidazolonepropionase-like amidohydrolase